MKNILFLFLLIPLFSSAQSQDCIYDVNEKTDSTSLKVTPQKLLHERLFGNSKEFIFFNLINESGTPMLVVQQIQKNNAFIPVNCLDKKSKIIFQLANGKIVTLVHSDLESCSQLNYDSETKDNIRILTGYFYFTQSNYEELSKSSISLMRIQFVSETKDYVVASEYFSETFNNKTNPKDYFIDYLKCVQ